MALKQFEGKAELQSRVAIELNRCLAFFILREVKEI